MYFNNFIVLIPFEFVRSCSVDISFLLKMSVGFGLFFIKTIRKGNRTEPNTSRSISRRNKPNGQHFERLGVHIYWYHVTTQCCEPKTKMPRSVFRFFVANVGRFRPVRVRICGLWTVG